MAPAVQASLRIHKEENIIAVQFPKDKALISRFRKLPGARWSSTLKSWYLPDTADYRKRFGLKENPSTTALQAEKNSDPQPTPETNLGQAKTGISDAMATGCNGGVLLQVRELLILKGYSRSTQRTYLNELAQFLKLLVNIPAEKLTASDVKRYMVYCHEKIGLSENTLHSRINSLKFYYEQVLHRERFFWEIPRPKRPLLLPKLLNPTEIAKLFNALSNKKHKAMLFTAYSAGLRVSEVVNLKISDIDSGRMQILVRVC